MNFVDIILILFLVGWAVRGYLIGFNVSLTTFTGVIAGLAGGIFLTMRIADVLPNIIEDATTMVVLVYLILFFLISTFFRAMAWFFRNALKSSEVIDADSFSGAVVGIVEGLILSSVLLIAIVFSSFEAPRNAIRDSGIAKYMLYSARVVMYSLPPDVKERANEIIESSSIPIYKPRQNSAVSPTPSPVG